MSPWSCVFVSPLDRGRAKALHFTRNSENASFYRFQKMYEWLSMTGYPAINVWQELATEGKPNLPYDTPIELFRPSEMWPSAPSQKEALRAIRTGSY